MSESYVESVRSKISSSGVCYEVEYQVAYASECITVIEPGKILAFGTYYPNSSNSTTVSILGYTSLTSGTSYTSITATLAGSSKRGVSYYAVVSDDCNTLYVSTCISSTNSPNKITEDDFDISGYVRLGAKITVGGVFFILRRVDS